MDVHEIIERDENLKSLMAIGKANELVIEMKHEVDKYTKLLQLAKEDQVYTIKSNVNYFPLLFRIKQEYFYALKNTDKHSKEYKDNKLMLKSLEKYLEEEVFKKPIKIVNLSFGGYEDYYYQIDFTIPDSDTKYFFVVPNPEVINTKNLEYVYDGKLTFGYYKSECLQYTEKTSYFVEDITKAFEELINKEHK